MNKLTCLVVIVRMTFIMPIWFYLIYQILIRVEATELMMFLFWVYLPLSVFLGFSEGIIKAIIEGNE